MRPPWTACTLILAALLLAPGALRAGGNSEPGSPERGSSAAALTRTTVQAYWLLEQGAANSEMLLERFYLPTSLSVLRWTGFQATGDGVELASTGGYRVVRKEPILTEPWDGSVLRGYTVRVDFTGPADKPYPTARTFTVSFSYDTARTGGDGAAGTLAQPLQRALLKGIEASGKKRGLARVIELRYQGRGRFQGRVEVQ